MLKVIDSMKSICKLFTTDLSWKYCTWQVWFPGFIDHFHLGGVCVKVSQELLSIAWRVHTLNHVCDSAPDVTTPNARRTQIQARRTSQSVSVAHNRALHSDTLIYVGTVIHGLKRRKKNRLMMAWLWTRKTKTLLWHGCSEVLLMFSTLMAASFHVIPFVELIRSQNIFRFLSQLVPFNLPSTHSPPVQRHACQCFPES